jgi:RNA-binding protein YlmH
MKTEAARYAHFHPGERPFVRRVEEWLERATQQYRVIQTEFLDPRQVGIVQQLAEQSGVAWLADGGYTGAERKRMTLAVDEERLEDAPALVALLAVSLTNSHATDKLDHRDYLGSLLGLGIKRDRVGDLQVHADHCHILLADEIASYVELNLTHVAKEAVSTALLPLDQLEVKEQELQEVAFFVSSLRLDAVLGDIYGISRSKILEPIRAGKCQVNWKTEENPSALLQAGDVLSLRGFGRSKLLAVEGVSKKGRIHVRAGKFV